MTNLTELDLKLYEVFANKELSRGCMFTGQDNTEYTLGMGCNVYENKVERNELIFTSKRELCQDCCSVIENNKQQQAVNIREAIGHPVMLGTVLAWLPDLVRGSDYFDDFVITIIDLWVKPDKPIQDQPKELKEFLLSLAEQYE